MDMKAIENSELNDVIEDHENNDNELGYNAFHEEFCGICSDIVIDRGVLDGCEHWFCYSCINQWAAITNRCPMCKSTFESIECTAVYDTVGNIDNVESSIASCDVDQFASGDDDSYMDEEYNALSFPSNYIDEDAVRCLGIDGCKIRCGTVEAEKSLKNDISVACNLCDIWYHALCVGFDAESSEGESWLCPRCIESDDNLNSEDLQDDHFTEDSFRVEKNHGIFTSSSFSGRVTVSVADEGETAVVVSMVSDQQKFSSTQSAENLPNEETGLEYLWHDTSGDVTLAGTSLGRMSDGFSEWNEIKADFELTEDPSALSPVQQNQDYTVSLAPAEEAPGFSYSDGTLMAISIEESNSKSTENKVINLNTETGTSIELGYNTSLRTADLTQNIVYGKGRHKSKSSFRKLQKRDAFFLDDHMKETHSTEMAEPVRPLKKHKPAHMVNFEKTPLKESNLNSETANVAGKPISEATTDEAKQKAVRNVAENKPGLRVKMIVRKKKEENEAALVQKLKEEIRELVGNSGAYSFGDNHSSDEKLLTAFRSALGKPELSKDSELSTIRVRKSLLQKGKIRENLTKKLYATTAGKRKTAWHRDWEVEFWKYRCSSKTKSDDVETLQSIIELLKKTSNTEQESSGSGRDGEGEASKSILSRIYLADASLFPRTDDVKPLSALTECSSCPSIAIAAGREKKKELPGLNIQNTKGDNSKKQANKPESVKTDKRKWALEVLARKNNISQSVSSESGSLGGNALVGNCPFLAQLPADMRPVLSPSCNNKVPMAVRQAQLHRIAECYLRKTNLAALVRCADTELAVADAINMEKHILEKSGSKSVYLNLCAQVVRQHTKPSTGKSKIETSASDELSVNVDKINMMTEEALKKSGLSFDSQSSSLKGEISTKGNDTNESMISLSNCPEIEVSITEKSQQTGTINPNKSSINVGKINTTTYEALRKAGLLFDSPSGSPERENSSDKEDVHGSMIPLSNCPDSNTKYAAVTLQNIEPDESCVPSANHSDMITGVKSPSKDAINCYRDTDSSRRDDAFTQGTCCDNSVSQKLPEGERNKGYVDEANQQDHDNTPSQTTDMEITTQDLKSCSPNIMSEMVCGTASEVKPRQFSDDAKPVTSLVPTDLKCSEGDLPSKLVASDNAVEKAKSHDVGNCLSNCSSSISKKVEAYIKEHVRPLCKSSIITVEQYRWAVAKTTEKVMRYHCKAENASFLIKEGEKVKKLAMQYVEASQQMVPNSELPR